jgi:hypothetical protein
MFGFLKRIASRTNGLNPFRHRRRAGLRLENLESRTLLTTAAQLYHAYGYDSIALYDGGGNYYPGDGSGQTIAITIAYDYPNFANDLYAFDAAYGIPDPPSITKATPQGTPSYNSGWAEEAALDLQYAHTMAPGADLLLVEATSNSYSALMGAVNYARNQPSVSVVSMSWGGAEFSGENSYDGYFTTPSGHNGVTFVAASGDTRTTSFPAISPNVVSVGGTNLYLSGGEYNYETPASFSGGGYSRYESAPDYQAGFHSNSHRANPDVAAAATNLSIRFNNGNYAVSGTSASAPQWAGLLAVANEQMNLLGYDTLDGRSQTLPSLYGLASLYGNPGYGGADFNDVPSGAGYNTVTGLGSPIAYNLVPDLVTYATGGFSGTSSTPVAAHATPLTVTPGSGSSTGRQTPVTGPAAPTPPTAPAKPSPIRPNLTGMDDTADPTAWQLVNQINVSAAATVLNGTGVARANDLRNAMLPSPTTLRTNFFAPAAHLLAHSSLDLDLGDLGVRPDETTGVSSGQDGTTTSRWTPIIAPVSGKDWDQADLSLAALSPEAVDAFFASQAWMTSLTDAVAGTGDSSGPAADPLAAAAGLAVVLGSYWGSRRAEFTDERKVGVPSLRRS